ncbi:radical SAM protein [Desulfovibrio litoralis]|uniref:Radical SAM methylthiotransferase, MiaB/RimO family n=1 Tax=Desulfovibrio litoralis DSM 11393 TaxID=1121455 RepID=A0A1M7TFB9_9BACT|nr:radical SAM protein [Desulfovibrio litoralis]SHN69462.1 radical SAM methylthiotransferase, MiaB/RimO family [Desulfovibrio litoralis DSM 11393]
MNKPVLKHTFALITHGCRVNQYESEAIIEAWLKAGWSQVEPDVAELIVLTSCAVTARAVSSARRACLALHQANPQAKMIFTGCAATLEEFMILSGDNINQDKKIEQPLLKTKLHASLRPEEKDLLLKLPELDFNLLEAQKTRRELFESQNKNALGQRVDLPFPAFKMHTRQRSRATIKIQDGCSHGCAYCIVPFTRGVSRSREFDDIINEAKALVNGGLSEIVLSGINLRQFKPSLWQLIPQLEQALVEFKPEKTLRIRLSSLDPAQLTTEALDCIANSRILVPHLHLSLQSGSAETLVRMKRGHYQPEQINDFIEKVSQIWSVFGLGADILVGFPAETEREWLENMCFIDKLPLSYAHVFPYSKRPGTLAATYPNQLKKDLIKERAKQMRDLIELKKQSFLKRLFDLKIAQALVFELNSSQLDKRNGKKGVSQFFVDCFWESSKQEQMAFEKTFGIANIIQTEIMRINDEVLIVKPLD